MRILRLIVISFLFVSAPLVRGGVYVPAERPISAPIGRTAIDSPDQESLVRAIAIQRVRRGLASLGRKRAETDQAKVQDDPAVQKDRARYLDQITAMEEKDRAGTLTIEDRVNLSGLHLRFFGPGNEDRAEKAIRVLTLGDQTPVERL